jgi:hypothetical protein
MSPRRGCRARGRGGRGRDRESDKLERAVVEARSHFRICPNGMRKYKRKDVQSCKSKAAMEMTGKKRAVLSRKGNVTRGRGNSRQIYGFLVWRGGSDPSSRLASEEGGRTNKILPRAWLPDLGSPDKTSILEIYSILPSRPLREVIQ